MAQIWRGRGQCSLEGRLQDWKLMRFACYDGGRMVGDASWNLTRRWGAGMRTCWWACICVGVLTCSAAYQHFKQPSLPTGPLHDVDSAACDLEPDQLPNGQKEARLE